MSGHRRRDGRILTRIVITGGVLLACLGIGATLLLTSLRKEKATEKDEPAFEIEELEDIPETEDSAADENTGDETDIDISGAENGDLAENAADSAKENGTGSDAQAKDDAVAQNSEESGTDPQAASEATQGAQVDIAKLLNASSVGENSKVTYGIDVSRFQGTIDWAQVAGAGIDFAMVRVGYRDSATGEIKADSNAKYNMQEAEKNGI